jgi:hypothetical protein
MSEGWGGLLLSTFKGPIMSHRAVEIITCVASAVRYAEQTKSWVVILVPSKSSIGPELRTIGLGSLPRGTRMVGLTGYLPKGGKLSFVDSSYIPFDTKFSLLLVGTVTHIQDVMGLAHWKTKATKLITLSETPLDF